MTRSPFTLGDLVNNDLYRGVSTGFNKAFIIDRKTRERLIREDPNCSEMIKPVLNGADLRPWYQSESEEWLVFTRRGINIDDHPSIKAHLEQFREQLEPQPSNWDRSKKWKGRKPGTYQWYEIQDSVEYYWAFEESKIFWPDITKYPRFSWDDSGTYLKNTGYIAVTPNKWLLAFLASRCAWYLISKISISLGERAGLMRYRLVDQYMRPLPVPDVPNNAKEDLAEIATNLTETANSRYQLHERVRQRIVTDWAGKKALGNKLTAWWELDFPTFRAEFKSRFKRDIPVAERDEWQAWLAAQRAEHERLTAAIIRLETDLNARVYALFDLTPAEIQIIEEGANYPYGAV